MIGFQVEGKQWDFDTVPNTCPICHHAMEPKFLTGVLRLYQAIGKSKIELVFQCPQRECLHAFIGRYEGGYDRNVNDHRLELVATAPFIPSPPTQPDEVTKLSPTFTSIYAEAASAEARQLKQIAGSGYRKALEYLIKDYCISENPGNAEQIKAQFLGTVINNYVADVNIKECAKRAAWLGNDETHYVRLWVDKDIADLKVLIALTVSWVNTHLLTQQYLKRMPG